MIPRVFRLFFVVSCGSGFNISSSYMYLLVPGLHHVTSVPSFGVLPYPGTHVLQCLVASDELDEGAYERASVRRKYVSQIIKGGTADDTDGECFIRLLAPAHYV